MRVSRLTPVLQVAALTCCFGLCWAEATLSGPTEKQPSEIRGPVVALPSVEDLSKKISQSTIRYPSMLFIGGFHGGELLISAVTVDPGMPKTLDVYFDEWNAAARAHLLTTYASVLLSKDSPPAYNTLKDDERREQRARDRRNQERIEQVVASGRYAEDWKPFVEAYRAFRADVLRRVPEQPNGWELFEKIDAIAKEHELDRLVGSVRFAPEDVATEMLRLVSSARGETQTLFYVCDGELRFHQWHALAPTLRRVLTTPADATQAPIENTVREQYQRLQQQFTEWLRNNPRTDDATKNATLERLAEGIGLLNSIAQAQSDLEPLAGSNPPAAKEEGHE